MAATSLGPASHGLLWPPGLVSLLSAVKLCRYELCGFPSIQSVSKCSSGFSLGPSFSVISLINSGSQTEVVPIRDELSSTSDSPGPKVSYLLPVFPLMCSVLVNGSMVHLSCRYSWVFIIYAQSMLRREVHRRLPVAVLLTTVTKSTPRSSLAGWWCDGQQNSICPRNQ